MISTIQVAIQFTIEDDGEGGELVALVSTHYESLGKSRDIIVHESHLMDDAIRCLTKTANAVKKQLEK